MTDLFGNPVLEPAKPAKPAKTPVQAGLTARLGGENKAICHQPPPNTPIRPIASVIREGKPRETQTTTIWNQ